jgi:hypothetical protein
MDAFRPSSTWQDVINLLHDFLKDAKYGTVVQSTALYDMSLFNAMRKFDRPANPVGYGERKLVTEMLLYMRFASCAYGAWSVYCVC